MRIFFYVFFSLILSTTFIFAQEKCASQVRGSHIPKPGQLRLKRFESLNTISGIIRIPVVVHVIHNSRDNVIGAAGSNNISDDQIKSQIRVLNEDYRRKPGTNGYNNNPVGADTEIEFYLATTDPDCKPTTGITRHYSDKKDFNVFSDERLVKSYGYWPASQYLNIWICDLDFNYLGYSQFPNYSNLEGINAENGPDETDGIIIDHNVFGSRIGTANKGKYSYGRTVTHEIGHWLGLLHTWGDMDCGEDYVYDTPKIQGSNLSGTEKCVALYSSCDFGAGEVRNMIENYLDYSPDLCMNIFTKGQKERMRSVFTTSPNRIKILTSKGLDTTSYVTIPYNELFMNEGDFIKNWENNDISNGWKNAEVGFEGERNGSIYITNPVKDKKYLTFSPWINFAGTNDVALLFDLAYPLANATDTLTILVDTSCNVPPVRHAVFTKNNLITATKVISNFYDDKDTWKTKYVDLSKFKTQDFIKVGLKYSSNGGNPVYVDNIRVIQKSDVINTKARSLYFFDVQSNFDKTEQKIMLAVYFNGPADISFDIIDASGRTISSKNYYNAMPRTFYLDFFPGSPGLYFVKSTANGQTKINKIVIY